jgi:hypothetical protein
MPSVSVTRDPYFAPAQGVAQSTTFNELAKGWIGYAQNSVDQTGISGAGSYDITDVHCAPFVHTNRLIKVSGSATFTVTSAAVKFSLDVVEGGTTLARLGEFTADDTSTTGFIARGGVIQLSGFTWQIAPSGGITHTYKLQLTIISGTGTIAIAGTNPAEASLFVEDMGVAS